MISTDPTISELSDLFLEDQSESDELALRALRGIWLEAIMVESFDDVADLIQSAIS
jgi:hypothetical protein